MRETRARLSNSGVQGLVVQGEVTCWRRLSNYSPEQRWSASVDSSQADGRDCLRRPSQQVGPRSRGRPYNAGLQERIEAWKNHIPVRVFDQINQLADIKEIRSDVAGVFSQVLQDTLRRLDKTYKAFFARVKRGQKAGFPRFKGRNRYDSFTYPQNGFKLNGKLQLSKIGNIKI